MGSFFAPEIDMNFRDGEGASLVCTREALTASPKIVPISGTKNEPSDFFSVESRTYEFLIHTLKVARLHSDFSLSTFWSKNREIDQIVIVLEVVCLRPYRTISQMWHVPPHPLHTMIPQSKIIILHSICTHRLWKLQQLLYKNVFTL